MTNEGQHTIVVKDQETLDSEVGRLVASGWSVVPNRPKFWYFFFPVTQYLANRRYVVLVRDREKKVLRRNYSFVDLLLELPVIRFRILFLSLLLVVTVAVLLLAISILPNLR